MINAHEFFKINRTPSKQAEPNGAKVDRNVWKKLSFSKSNISGTKWLRHQKCSRRLASFLRHTARIGPDLLCHLLSVIRRPSSAVCPPPSVRLWSSVICHSRGVPTDWKWWFFVTHGGPNWPFKCLDIVITTYIDIYKQIYIANVFYRLAIYSTNSKPVLSIANLFYW